VSLLFLLVARLCALVMLSALAQLLLPAGNMRKYARLVCGLLVLHIMVSQVFAWLRQISPTDAPDVGAWLAPTSAQPLREGQRQARQARLRSLSTWAAAQAEAAGVARPGIELLVDAADTLLGLRVTGDIAAADAQADALRQRIAGALGISPPAVTLQQEGEDGS
jgi:stage III sporulation protein AF